MYPNTLFLDMGLYEICIALAIIVAMATADRMGIKRGFSVRLQKLVIFSAVGAVVIGFLGAVLFQAFYNFMESGKFVISVSTGMTFYGGLIFGAGGYLAVWFGVGKRYCKDNEPVKKFGAMADIAAGVLPLAHGIGRFGCLFAGCCHGRETDAWYGVKMHTEYGYIKVVPVQLFEAIVLLVIAGVILWLYFKQGEKKRTPLLPVYMVSYGIWRFAIEYARGDDRGATVLSFLSPSQLIALVLILAGVGYLIVWYRRKKTKENIQEKREETENGKNGSNESI